MTSRRVSPIDAAAVAFAAYHVLLLHGLALSQVWLAYRGGGIERSFGRVAGLAVFAILLSAGVGISLDLARRRERGREWFSRYVSIEVGIVGPIASLAFDRDALSVDEQVFLCVAVVVSAAFFVAKITLRRQMADPRIRREFSAR